ncbi:threonine aldolase family protein [Acidaminococcus timonensis]|uniref:threonine aldolase family protein n=1 Tax=Acidaminococcus timonensis TaxID=1871002 RepID=UPI000A87FC6E|nr:aminotransferase class I/II-fold pyridoxal phosphate-dependent enzyme [Acidaminococcus timonensis]
METKKIQFASDYQEGAAPEILARLQETNWEQTAGYGEDGYSESARSRIREACQAPEAEIHFLVGGTQTNATVIDTVLRPYQGVVAAATGHVNVHEAGAIEYGGHKVLAVPEEDGRLTAKALEAFVKNYWDDANREHMVMPGMVYLSQPTEMGTLYTLAELEAIRAVCTAYKLPLFVDGARLAYALGTPENDVTLPDLARLCDVFYIGGTKCGALFGEAVVFPKPGFVPHFFTMVKQHGALLAKGRISGLQFETLFTDGLYEGLGRHGIQMARKIRRALLEKGYELPYPAPTNQLFLLLDKKKADELAEKVVLGFGTEWPDGRVLMRICTSWATREEDVEKLIAVL